MRMGVRCLFGLCLLLLPVFSSFEIESVLEQTAHLDTLYNGTTEKGGVLTVYTFTVEQDEVVRVSLRSNNANRSTPLLAVFREPATIISVQLPIVIKNYMYSVSSRTLCPFHLTAAHTDERNISISVELNSFVPVHYSFIATIVKNFHLTMGTPLEGKASASEPVFYQFTFPPDLDAVVIWINSTSSTCMTVSIQRAECPVFDLDNNVIAGGGLHQTMTKAGSITVERHYYESFFVAFVIRPNDDDCSEMEDIQPPYPHYIPPREKQFTVTIQSTPNKVDYVIPIALTFGAIFCIYTASVMFMVTMGIYEKRALQREGDLLVQRSREGEVVDAAAEPYLVDENGVNPGFDGTPNDLPSTSREEYRYRQLPDTASIGSYDTLQDCREKEVLRQNLKLTVADLSIKTWEQRDKKYTRYVLSLITIACFYGLPAVQLVLTWQDTVRTSGNLDLCWYNFRCARPFFVFFAFNNVISNCGYISLGLLILFMVKERDMRYKSLCHFFPLDLKNEYGLPQHNGLMYAIGMAVVMEGVLSAAYHICPSSSNYQFDTSFMYIIGMMGMLKIYQLRHPDLNANAHVAFALSAFFIFIAMLGVYLNNLAFWIAFSLVYVMMMFVVSVQFYFKGLWRLNVREILRTIHYAFLSSHRCSCLVPAYKSRFLFLVIGNSINFSVVVLGMIYRPKDFPSFLLFPFVANLFLYLLYYITMKFIHREKMRARAIVFLVMAFLCWSSAMWFFLNNVTDWSQTPANSRELNSECILFAFYDKHDVWHFLSSIAIFMSFSLINCIDDDLIWVRRDKIAVF